MLTKTKGLVINYLKYRETSLLVTIYTSELGIASYIENGVRSVKAKHKMALFQPLTLLDMEVYSKPGKGLNRISELKCYFPYQHIPFDIAKSSIALFLSEVLNKVLKEEEANPLLFHFLEESLQFLDTCSANFENFHIQFLWNLSAFLGFSPSNALEFYQQLALARSEFGRPDHLEVLNQLILLDYGKPFVLSKIQRKEILAALIQYYQIHVESFGELRSTQILQEVLA
jgi:DNA repair protein RecO (recombination protein O)